MDPGTGPVSAASNLHIQVTSAGPARTRGPRVRSNTSSPESVQPGGIKIMSSTRVEHVETVAQDARHTTGEWLTWALDAVEDPRAEFESTLREIVAEKMSVTRQGAEELMHDVADDLETARPRDDRAA
jgi:hypothetical protein